MHVFLIFCVVSFSEMLNFQFQRMLLEGKKAPRVVGSPRSCFVAMCVDELCKYVCFYNGNTKGILIIYRWLPEVEKGHRGRLR